MTEPSKLPPDLYRAVFDAAPDAIIIVTPDGRIRSVNPRVAELFGYEAEELVGELVEILVPDAQRSRHVSHRSSFHDAPRSRAMGLGLELEGRRKDGTTFPIEVGLSSFDTHEDDCLQRCVIAIVRDVSERARTRLQAAARMQASEAERRRIAQELHDDTAQRLAALLLQLRLVARSSSGIDDDVIEGLRDQVEAISDGVRRVARGLRPPELDDVGLGPALRMWARTVSEEQDVDVVVEADPVVGRLDSEGQLMLYRIVQEAITNVVRHSGAQAAAVEVKVGDDEIQATVRDDGRGFDAVHVLKEGHRLGLPGMLERASMIGGRIGIDSEPGAGTTVTVTLPCARADNAVTTGS